MPHWYGCRPSKKQKYDVFKCKVASRMGDRVVEGTPKSLLKTGVSNRKNTVGSNHTPSVKEYV